MATAPHHGRSTCLMSKLSKYSVLEATKQIFVYRNDSTIDPCQKVKINNYHLEQLFRTVSQIDAQHIMLGFLAEGHI